MTDISKLQLTTKQQKLYDEFVQLQNEMLDARILILNGYGYDFDELYFLNGQHIKGIHQDHEENLSSGDYCVPDWEEIVKCDNFVYSDIINMDNDNNILEFDFNK